MGLLGILVGLAGLIYFAFKGSSILIIAPLAGLVVAAFAGEPLLASWTQTFMPNAAQFVAQFFPLFLLGAIFGKLMEDSGSVTSVARFMTQKLGSQRAILAVVLAGAIGLMLIRSFFEVEMLGPYFMASFIVYYGLFTLTPLPAFRRRRAVVPAEDERLANGRMPAPI